MKRRRFLASAALAAAPAFAAEKPRPLIGIQIAGHSLLDEGMERCLDTVQSTCHANAIFLYSHSYYAAHGRAPELYADHGVAIKDERKRQITRVWLRHHADAFKGTSLGVPEPDGEYGERDLFAETVDACRKRGLHFYARILEPDIPKLQGRVKNAERVASIGLDGQPSSQPCRNHPEWMAWWDALVSDTLRSYPLDGFQWGAERMGPLSSVLWKGAMPFCFCQHCEARAKREGIRVERAKGRLSRAASFHHSASHWITGSCGRGLHQRDASADEVPRNPRLGLPMASRARRAGAAHARAHQSRAAQCESRTPF